MADTTVGQITSVFPITPEALKPHPQFARRRSIIRDFSLNTSTHGVPSIARSQSIPNRLFWIISTLIFCGVMLYFVVQSIITYFTYPTQTSVSVVIQKSQPFPAVSICNYSPVRFDRFIDPFLNFTNSRNLTNTTDNSTITFQQANYIRDFFQYLFNGGQQVTDYLFPLDGMLLGCNYNGDDCNASVFLSFLSSAHGQCFTFNAKMVTNQSRTRLTTDGGGIGKLSLRLYAQSHQYVPYISEDVSSGMVAMIHDNTELPLIEVAGIQLAPGRRHKLTYKKRTHQLLSAPYTQCTDKIPLVMQAMFRRYQGADYSYSQELCNTLCVQSYVYHECSCVDPLQWTARTIIVPGTQQETVAPLCNISDKCYTNATDRITNTQSIWNQFCSDCTEACSTVDFIVTPSSVSAPANAFLSMFKQQVESSSIPLPVNWSTTWINELENNYVAVDIVAENTRVETYEEDASISSVDLISNIGGQTGLWIGVSFLTLMEVAEMLYRLMWYQTCVVRNRIRMKKEEKNDQLQNTY